MDSLVVDRPSSLCKYEISIPVTLFCQLSCQLPANCSLRCSLRSCCCLLFDGYPGAPWVCVWLHSMRGFKPALCTSMGYVIPFPSVVCCMWPARNPIKQQRHLFSVRNHSGTNALSRRIVCLQDVCTTTAPLVHCSSNINAPVKVPVCKFAAPLYTLPCLSFTHAMDHMPANTLQVQCRSCMSIDRYNKLATSVSALPTQ